MSRRDARKRQLQQKSTRRQGSACRAADALGSRPVMLTGTRHGCTQAVFAEVQRIHLALDRIRNPEDYEESDEEEEQEPEPPPPPSRGAKKPLPPKKGKPEAQPAPEPEPEPEPKPEPETEEELVAKLAVAEEALEKANDEMKRTAAALTEKVQASQTYLVNDLSLQVADVRAAIQGDAPLCAVLYVYQAADPPLPEPEPLVRGPCRHSDAPQTETAAGQPAAPSLCCHQTLRLLLATGSLLPACWWGDEDNAGGIS